MGQLFKLDPLDKLFVLPKPQDELTDEVWAIIHSLEAAGQLRITCKRDGYCTTAITTSNRISLHSRQNTEWTGKFLHIEQDLRDMNIPHDTLVCGESTVTHNGRDDPNLFGRFALSGTKNSHALQKEFPRTHLSLFDVIIFKGKDVSRLPYDDRMDILRNLCARSVGHISLIEHFDVPLAAAQQIARERKLEGLVLCDARAGTSFRLDANWSDPLRPDGRWKWKIKPTTDFVATGWIPSTAATHFGQVKELILGLYHPITRELIGFGNAGVGLKKPQRLELMTARYPLVAEVRYELIRKNNTLKNPVIERIRDDKLPEECIFPFVRAP
ncbi:MAG: hypothetical protein KBD06_04310 [Candidatus Pacebacteria bacterium]|nr:hypothetical protein [Candidatus Paceibacterota bacterium]